MTSTKKPPSNPALKLDDFLPFQLSIAANAASTYVSSAYRSRFGLKIPEWRLVAVLAEAEELTQQAICDRTKMDKVTVSRATAKLVQRGLINRAPNQEDGRSHQLRLSDDGRDLVNLIVPTALALEKEILKSLTSSERKQLANLLERVRTRVEALCDQPL